MVKFGRQVPVILCGDINANIARWVGIYSESVPVRKVVDESKNSQGEVLVDFLRGMKMTIVYGRKGRIPSLVCLRRGVQWFITALWGLRILM